jgi:hypothetical protein
MSSDEEFVKASRARFYALLGRQPPAPGQQPQPFQWGASMTADTQRRIAEIEAGQVVPKSVQPVSPPPVNTEMDEFFADMPAPTIQRHK